MSSAVDFLQRYRPAGPWVLAGINPLKKSSPEVATFDSYTEPQLREWLEERIGKLNLYFHVNPCLRPMGKKAQREDIKEMAWLHVDIDPKEGESVQDAGVRALGMLQKPPGGVPKPTVIIFSGGGYQGFWCLRDPYEINGEPAKYEAAKLYNKQLEIVFGGDNCHNVDRIMRLPGTVNIPNELKRAKGREPALAYVVEFDDDRVYALEEFQPAVEVQSGHQGFAPMREVEVSGNVPPITPEELEQLMKKDERGWRAVCLGTKAQEMDGPKEGDNSRSAWLMHGTCAMVRCGMTDEQMFAVLMDNEYGISESILSAPRPEDYAKRQIGRAREMVDVPELCNLNDRFALIANIGGKCRVLEESTYEGRINISFLTPTDFKTYFCNQLMESGATANGQPKLMPLGDWWIRSPQRRSYDKVVFCPTEEVPSNFYNLWRGWGVEAIPGDCSLFLEHLRTNLCRGNEEHYEYLINWMANAVQHPNTPGQVAVVIRGRKGTGKSFFANHFGRLFGNHFLPVSNAAHLVGNFNSHLRDCVLLFADEAYFAGDKKHEANLKTIVTESKIVVEAKGLEATLENNYIHLIMASNEDWVVPAGADERRFFALQAGDERMQDNEYFELIKRQLDSGGYEALLHQLLTHDLTGFQLRDVPATEELQVQKGHTLQPHEQWWSDKLHAGILLSEEAREQWPTRVWGHDLWQDYLQTMDAMKVNRRQGQRQMGKWYRRWGLVYRQETTGKRKRYYEVPTLEDARRHWEATHGPEEWMAPEPGGDNRSPEDTEVPF